MCSDHWSRPKNVERALIHRRSDAGESDAVMLPMQAASVAISTTTVLMVAQLWTCTCLDLQVCAAPIIIAVRATHVPKLLPEEVMSRRQTDELKDRGGLARSH